MTESELEEQFAAFADEALEWAQYSVGAVSELGEEEQRKMDAAFGKHRMDEQESDAWLLSIARVRSAADSGRRHSLEDILAEAGLGAFGVNLDDLSHLDDETDII